MADMQQAVAEIGHFFWLDMTLLGMMAGGTTSITTC